MEKYLKMLRPCLEQLKPYVTGKGYLETSRKYGFAPEKIIKLGSNENPYGPSQEAIRAMQMVSPEKYPEPEDLIEALSIYTGYPSEMIILGAGMDGVMDTLTRLFLDKGDKTFIPIPTFSYYEILTHLSGAMPIFAERRQNFEVPLDFPRNVKMVFLCSPNNPTGNMTPESDVRQILEGRDAIVFLDEAYVDFADNNLLKLVEDYDNLIVGRTMSKAFGLAGLRLGYAIAPEWIVREYRRAAPPFFGLTSASVAAGTAALSDLEHMRRSVSMIRSERERLQSELRSHPSQANFLYITTTDLSDVVAEQFFIRGIIIRDCRSFRGAGDHHIRVTVGTPEQNNKLLAVYTELCK